MRLWRLPVLQSAEVVTLGVLKGLALLPKVGGSDMPQGARPRSAGAAQAQSQGRRIPRARIA